MILKDDQGNVWKTGLKLDYTPKMIPIKNQLGINTHITAIGCGRKHYAMVNQDNQLLVWGNVFKAKSDKQISGFNIYYGDTLFENGKCKNLSMKYGLFGVVVDNKGIV